MTADRAATMRRLTDLAKRFQSQCLAVRIPFRHRCMYWSYLIGLARKGKQVYSETHDAHYAEGFWKRGYDKSCEKINLRLSRRPGHGDAVPVPSFQPGEVDVEGIQHLMSLNVPFVLRNGASNLPMKDWTLNFLKETAGECSVPINGASDRPSEDRSRPTKSNHYYDFHTGTLAEVIDSIQNGGALRASVAEDVMHHNEGRLRRDIDLPHFERLSGWEKHQKHWFRSRMMVGKIASAQLLVQPEKAFTLWHTEPGDNFFVLSKGTKTWTLAHPYYTAAFRPRVKSTTNYFGSNIDLREPEDVLRQRGFNGYLGIPLVRVELYPGDILRVPNYWWHTIVTHPGSETIAISIRSGCNMNTLGFGFGVLRLFDESFHKMAKAFAKEGRIRDIHIGFPRKSRDTSRSAGRLN